MRTIHFAPHISTVESIARERYSLAVVLPELIDNALDKEATIISLNRNSKVFVVEDNGTGVADLQSLLQMGGHHNRSGRRTLGRYGVGFKHAAIWLAERVEVESRHRNQITSFELDWPSLEKWEKEVADPTPSKGDPFTRFTFSSIRNQRLSRLAEVAPTLSYLFSPALANGISIILNGDALTPASLPEIEDTVVLDDNFEGRHFRLTAGIKVAGDQPNRWGFDVAYLHRIILTSDASGCGGLSAQRFYAYLELLDDGDTHWTLSTHKGDFDERDALYDALFPSIQPLLEKSQQLGDRIELRDLEQDVNKDLAALKASLKEARSRGISVGTKEPTGTGSTRKKATKTQDEPGQVLDKRLHGALDIRFDCRDPNRIGYVQQGKNSIIISLNEDFEIIRTNPRAGVIAAALALLSMHWTDMPDQRELFAKDLVKPHGLDPTSAFTELYTELIKRVVPAPVPGVAS